MKGLNEMLSSAANAISKAASATAQKIDEFFSPPRTRYNEAELPKVLVTTEEDNIVGNYIRTPFKIMNARKQMIHGSIYKLDKDIEVEITKCLIYLHGVSSSQLEGQFLVPNLCSYHIAVCCFDFIGCGNSDGKMISLGYYEHIDTEFVIKMLEQDFGYKEFALWGRSMGAATALLTKSDAIKSMVIDSAFSSADELFGDLAAQKHIPKSVLVGSVKLFAQASFGNDFSIDKINCLEAVKQNPAPAAYGHATSDNFIPFSHGKTLFDNHNNKDKDFMELTGGHNGYRSADWIRYGVAFVLNHFGEHVNSYCLEVSECRKLQAGNEQFDSFSSLLANKKVSPAEETPEKEKSKDEQKEEKPKSERKTRTKKVVKKKSGSTKKEEKMEDNQNEEKINHKTEEPLKQEGESKPAEDKPKKKKVVRKKKAENSEEKPKETETETNKEAVEKPKKHHSSRKKTTKSEQEKKD
ncbi:hypothetical protein TVAG_460750 [Trichomonas vaginalis G3]|uniref:AB hydrolase-1 domain-containing protein n=1 Tax=Trichomonas vaginalis (strain ATCC PRA-98 / G3) TaxID=412133 RepID=A2DY49_TRIV3|nr:palmitoyl-(protein) hydrolase protein [Trichomonas vaginalis G3]EAY14658.1 hypothetical protein TVAG_460750 [Trichomonas vaginalis G3]KAI5505408.1 palmitoyl-(protein) hydrolase protein [Trichomonas vaginalis G3]|eukprot:XP_001326881.1 hypothetical protein [Trichomonas vaginalis G3]